MLSQDLAGTWKLVSRRDATVSGEPRVDPSLGEDPIALLFYDRHGHFGAQFMKRDRSAPTTDLPTASSNNGRAVGGYDAYFGAYSVDDSSGLVTQRIEGALSAETVGLVLSRRMDVFGNTLTIRVDTTSADGEPVVRTLVWERVG